MNVRRQTLQTVDLPLGSGQPTVRVTLTRDAEGKALELGVAVGFGGGEGPDPFRPERGVSIPGRMVPELRAALGALEDRKASPKTSRSAK